MPFWSKLLLSIVTIEAVGGLGAAVTSSQITEWYATLARPPGTPPNWLFGPVWTCLYAMVGGAIAIVWHRVDAGPPKSNAMLWFGVQLVLNLSWTPVFFGLHQMFVALLIIIAMWFAIAITIIRFRKLQPLAAALMIPYWLWVSYATYLNAGYWLLNR